MTKSNETLYSAFAKAHAEFKTPVRDKKAHYGDYASICSINESVREALSKNGLSVMQPLVTIDNQSVLKTILSHASGEEIVSEMIIPPINPNTKNYFHVLGSSISYMRRYCLLSILNISADGLDDDGDSLNDVKVDSVPVVDSDQADELTDLFKMLDKASQAKAFNILKSLGATKFALLPAQHFHKYAEILNSMKAEEQASFADEVSNV